MRVVSIGEFSKELCGGSHLDCTGQIGLFKITQESSVASGVRRIEAETGTYAYNRVKEQQGVLDQISEVLAVPLAQISEELKKRLKRTKELEKQLNGLQLEKINIEDFIGRAEEIRGIKLIKARIDNVDMGILRKTVDAIKNKIPENCLIIAGSKNAGQAFLVLGLTADLQSKGLDASRLIKETASLVGGSGGGRSDFAQAGGNQPQNLDKAFEKIKELLQ